MNERPGRFQNHLTTDESLISIGSGTIVEDLDREPVSIGLTDHRILLLYDSGGFRDIGYEYVSSLRSRPKRTLTSLGRFYWTLIGCGAGLSALALVSVLALVGDGLVLGLTAVSVAGIVFAGAVRRDATDLREIVPDGAAGSYVDAIRDTETIDRYTTSLADADGHRIRRVGGGLVGVVALSGLLLSASNPLVVPFSIIAGGGLVLVDRAYHRKRDAEKNGQIRRRERELILHLVDQRTVRFRIDPDEIIDQELSRLARASATRPPGAELLSS